MSCDGQRLVRKHFTMQDQRPGDVAGVTVEALDPFLRSLVFADGTVTRALAVRTLARVAVRRVGQSQVEVPADLAAFLEVEAGGASVRRRVGIAVGEAAPVLWAESYLLPQRLPAGFMGLLEGAPLGIGQSLQQQALESSRELLWFGLHAPPRWAGAPSEGSCGAICRLYRILSGQRAAILICESFGVEEHDGVYSLAGLGGGQSVETAPLEASR